MNTVTNIISYLYLLHTSSSLKGKTKVMVMVLLSSSLAAFKHSGDLQDSEFDYRVQVKKNLTTVHLLTTRQLNYFMSVLDFTPYITISC